MDHSSFELNSKLGKFICLHSFSTGKSILNLGSEILKNVENIVLGSCMANLVNNYNSY